MNTTTQSPKTLLLTPSDVSSTDERLEVIGVFNPAAISVSDDEIFLLARVVQAVRQTEPDVLQLPRWVDGQIEIDSFAISSFAYLDPRVIQLHQSGLRRLAFTSHFQTFKIENIDLPASEWSIKPDIKILPDGELEAYGIEDPRITKLGDEFYTTYVAVSEHGVSTCILSSKELQNFERLGIAFVPENKDVVIFPEKINNNFYALHRPTPAQPFAPPSIWISSSPDLIHWGCHKPFLQGSAAWENGRIGGGAVPLRVGKYWLIVYHGSRKSSAAGKVGRYVATVALAAAEGEPRLLSLSNQPLFEPDQSWETDGFVSEVVFPTAIVQVGDLLNIFYGAADTSIGVIQMAVKDIMQKHFSSFI